jgi:hypothetical protein
MNLVEDRDDDRDKNHQKPEFFGPLNEEANTFEPAASIRYTLFA